MRNVPLGPCSTVALHRFLAVSWVLTLEQRGLSRTQAAEDVAQDLPAGLHGEAWERSARTVLRWVRSYEEAGIGGLEPEPRKRTDSSLVVPGELLVFVRSEKTADPRASLPEILRRAREKGIITAELKVDRTTLWRASQRMGLPMTRRARVCQSDCRRYAFPHRMQMVLCDGKHFKVGRAQTKRVALFFLDDCSRAALHVVVGPSESARLFLRGFYEMVRRYGLPGICYLDRGPGFKAQDTIDVLVKLNVLLLHGKARYPEGHGKIERFNRTALAQMLRNLSGRVEVDPDCAALDLRLSHYLRDVYNHTVHESLHGKTPWEVFSGDSAALRLPQSDEELRGKFVIHEKRSVSKDRVIPFDGMDYEVPRGLGGQKITVQRHVLDHTLSVIHEQRLVRLQPVDLAANARDRRSATVQESPEPAVLPKTAAELAFDRAHGPIVTPDGGFPETRSDS